jgi:hypothetical protein
MLPLTKASFSWRTAGIVYIDAQGRWLTAICKSVYIAAFPEPNSGTQEGSSEFSRGREQNMGQQIRFADGIRLAGRDADFVGGASGNE